MNNIQIGDWYKMSYHYGEYVIEQPFDFDQYRSKFDNAILLARQCLEMSSLTIRFDHADTKIQNFVKYGQVNTQPLLDKYLRTNNRIAGILSNISQMAGVSIDLESCLRDMARTCSYSNNYDANQAGLYLQEAADYIHACLSEVRRVREKEIWGGYDYTVMSPILNTIVSPEQIVKFTHNSSRLTSYLSAVSLYDRNMEQISSVSILGELSEVAFLDKEGKKTSNMKFVYYEKSDFPTWKEEVKDLWGYPLGKIDNEEYEVCEECEMYATLYSLKNIILSDGAKIEVNYERNKAKGATVGGIRLKSLVFNDELGERGDTISYSYPDMGVSVYKSYSNIVFVSYPAFDDKIEYDRVHLEGHPVVNMGNNGFYYPRVKETISGKGTITYNFKIASPSLITNYPYWLNGLLTEKTVCDSNGKLLKRILYNYDIYANGEGILPQMQPSNFYLDEKSLEQFYSSQGTSYLSGERLYISNIKPRLLPTNTDRFYNLHYGWKTALKEKVEYKSDNNIPYCRTKYCYDNSLSIHPTRIIRIGSDGIERTEVLKRVMDMADTVDSVFVDMKKANLLLPIVKSLDLVNGKLVNETVYRYKADKKLKIGSIVPVEKYVYIPDTPEVYVSSSVETRLFTHGESNYTTETSFHYASQKTSRMCVQVKGRTKSKSRAYDFYGKLLLECDVAGATAGDECKIRPLKTDIYAIHSLLNYLGNAKRKFSLVMDMVDAEFYDDQFLKFLSSDENYYVSSFAEEIMKSDPDLIWTKIYYNEIVKYDYEKFNKFMQEYERIINLYPVCKDMRPFVYSLEKLVHYSEHDLFDVFFRDYEIERPSNLLDYSLNLTPAPGIQNLRLYILDVNSTASGSITHAGGVTPYTVESLSFSKLKIYDIDLSKYTGITSVTANRKGSYMALVPEGANFEATSYNADGTIYASFDQSGNVEYYTYDAAGRVIEVKDQYGNILRTYEHNKIINK